MQIIFFLVGQDFSPVEILTFHFPGSAPCLSQNWCANCSLTSAKASATSWRSDLQYPAHDQGFALFLPRLIPNLAWNL